MKRLRATLISATLLSLTVTSAAMAQDAMRIVEHTGPAASPGASGSTGGLDTTVGGVGIGATGSPSVADVYGANRGLPSRAEAGTVSDATSSNGMTVPSNSTGAVANHLGIAGTGANGANPKAQSSP